VIATVGVQLAKTAIVAHHSKAARVEAVPSSGKKRPYKMRPSASPGNVRFAVEIE
jgi:hypothetical protein